jgi:TonB family protein
MNAALPLVDARETQDRTRFTMAVSVAVHALLLLALALLKPVVQSHDGLTEITMLDPGPPAGGDPSSPAAAPARQSITGAIAASLRNASFRRQTKDADLTPEPQTERTATDLLEARLATLQSRSVEPIAGSATATPGGLWGAAPATIGDGGGHGAPIALTRGGGGGSGPALALTRGPGEGARSTLALAPAPKAEADAQPEKGGDTGGRRTLAGVTLMGPIADRPVLHHVAPVYPEWAKHDGVEGAVTLYFIVRADGTIKENVLVQKTAGFGDFDDNARAALREWRFQPLDGGRTGEQWGTITFRYRLNSGG